MTTDNTTLSEKVAQLQFIGAYPSGLQNYPTHLQEIYIDELYQATRGMTRSGYMFWKKTRRSVLEDFYAVKHR